MSVAGALAAVNQNRWPDYVLVAMVMVGLVLLIAPAALLGVYVAAQGRRRQRMRRFSSAGAAPPRGA